MEKYLRLLNPKTTNFDAIGGGSHGSITTQDVCVAFSYAKLTILQDNLIRIKCLGANNLNNIDLLSVAILNMYEDRFEKSNTTLQYRLPVIRTALIEFCMVPANYKPSTRNRAVFAGVHHLIVHRYLNDIITEILSEFQKEYSTANEKLIFQIKSTN